jgi:hypothetical protein
MAITQQQVSDWFRANPNATPEQVAQVVQSIGGFEKNPELAGLLGQQYGTSSSQIKSVYGDITSREQNAIDKLTTERLNQYRDFVANQTDYYGNPANISYEKYLADNPIERDPRYQLIKNGVFDYKNATQEQSIQAIANINPEVAKAYQTPVGLMKAPTTDGKAANTAATTDTKQVAPSANAQKVLDLIASNPSITDGEIVSAMKQFNASPKDIAQSVGLSEGQVLSRIAATVPSGQSVTLGDTVIVPQYRTTGSGMDEQILGLESFATSKSNGDPNYKAPVGTPMQVYSADGQFVNTVKTKKDQSFFGGLVSALKDPVVLAALAAVTAGATGVFSAAPAASTIGLSAAEIAALTAQDLAIGGTTGLLTGTAATTAATAATAANAATAAATGLTTAKVAELLKTGLTGTQIAKLFSPSTTGSLSNLFSGGLTTAGSLLQQQTSKEAADKARVMIEAETAAGKQAAQFKPIGMTTRFGTSQFQTDPKTGQLTSAGYTLSPEAKNAQDRFITLAGQGLTQAEQAQAQFAPLQTGAQSLFGLGNKYLAQSPEAVAQNYLNQQMALLQPGRELELANLQNKLQQQGRGGLAVAQGGTLGATTPELQALFNARAQQEAQLAANAQQAGQQQVAFGAGLLGTGAQTLGQYYAGQQAAYTPYKTAVGEASALETLAQQPYMLSAQLADKTATAGKNVANIGLTGAQLSTNLATSANATANPYAQALMAAGNPNAMFGQTLNKLFENTIGAPAPPITPEQEAIDRYMKTFG